jgi:C4-dicarboxylate-specific signal transduction histidine kinase
MEYFQQLVSRAWNDTWDVVFAVPLRGIIITVLVFAFTLLLHWRRKGLEDMKDVLFGGVEGAVAAIILFVLVLLLHVFVVSPRHIATDIQRELTDEKRITKELRTAVKNPPADNSGRIRLDVADEEGRRELDKTKKELAEAKATIAKLDPKRQPIASATASVEITVESDQPVNSHFMDSGGAAALIRGSTPLLITRSVDCFGNQTGHGQVIYQGVFTMRADDSAVGRGLNSA